MSPSPFPSPTEIAETINENRDTNLSHGIVNADDIWPGQVLTYHFASGKDTTLVVKAGDTQWQIVDLLLTMEKIYGPLSDGSPAKPVKNVSFTNADLRSILVPLAFLLAILFFALLSYLSLQKSNAWKKLDPITSGPPMIIGGINDETAEAALRGQATRIASGPNFEVSNVRKGRFFGEGLVCYAGKPSGEKRRFNGEIGYAATLTRPLTEPVEIYCLQACGNDAREGQFLTGIIFHEDVNLSQAQAVATETEEVPVFQANNLLTGNEFMLAAREILKDKKNGNIRFSSSTDGVMVDVNFSEFSESDFFGSISSVNSETVSAH
jgi:hypothetical protein